MDTASVFTGLNGASWLLIIAGVGLLLVTILQAFIPRMVSDEPPLLKPRIPFVGHLVGLMRHQNRYFEILNEKYGLPTYTLPVLNGKIYVVTSPELAQSFLRVGREFDLEKFLVTAVGKNLDDFNPETMKIWSRIPEDRRQPYPIQDVSKAISKQLSPGPHLNQTILAANSKFADVLDKMLCPKKVSLFTWLRDTVTVPISFALFGSHDPFSADPSLVETYWTFDEGTFYILTGLFPKILASKALKARAKLISKFVQYYRAGYDKSPDVSAFMKGTSEAQRQHGFATDEIGKCAVGNTFGATTNTGPSFFWICLHIFADSVLKEEIRAELLNITTTVEKKETGRSQMTIDLTSIATRCPLLYSCHQETLRLRHVGVNSRMIEADTILSDSKTSYLVKKGVTIQLPVGIAQRTNDIWGPNSLEFDGKRFLKTTKGDNGPSTEASKEQEKMRKMAYFPFSGGHHLCPGRHFATSVIMGAATLLILGYDITAPDGATIVIPRHAVGVQKLTEAVAKPSPELRRMRARIRRREGLEDVEWKFVVTGEERGLGCAFDD